MRFHIPNILATIREFVTELMMDGLIDRSIEEWMGGSINWGLAVNRSFQQYRRFITMMEGC